MALIKPAPREMLDVMDTVIKPEIRDLIMLALSEGGDLNRNARIEQVINELADVIQRGDEKVERDAAIVLAKTITETCARRLDRLNTSSGTAQ